MPKKKTASFENTLEELESIVNILESGDIPLEEALQQFEKGVKLSQECQKALSDAERKIQILIDNNLKNFEESDD